MYSSTNHLINGERLDEYIIPSSWSWQHRITANFNIRRFQLIGFFRNMMFRFELLALILIVSGASGAISSEDSAVGANCERGLPGPRGPRGLEVGSHGLTSRLF